MTVLKKLTFAGVAGTMAVCAGLILAGCSSAEHDAIVARVGNDVITLSDFRKMYAKSNAGQDIQSSTQGQRDTLLDLMIRYRLKLQDAYDKGIDKRPDIQREVEQYKSSLASSYLIEHDVVSPGVQRLFDRRKVELRASHILIPLSQNPTAEDSIAAYKKAFEVLAQLHEGKSFEDLAVANSKDPSAQQNKGDLYYFTGGQLVASFEDSVFAMRPGEISSVPVRSSFGLHIIKLVERRPAPGERRASHIMIRFQSASPTPAETLAAYQKIQTLQDSLTAGTDFASLAKRHSEDSGSSDAGGDLGWFGRRRWPLPFDSVAMLLTPGQVSGIVRTAYGYHLIKCVDAHPPKTFDESKDELLQTYKQTRYNADYAAYVTNLKHEVRFTQDDSVAARFVAAFDSTRSTLDSAWSSRVTPALGASVIMTCGGKPISVDSVVTIMKTQPDFANLPLYKQKLLQTLDKISEQIVFGEEAETLLQAQPTFAATLDEFAEGTLLYQADLEEVWNKVASSDSVLQHYFDAHQADFRFPDRLNLAQLVATSDSAAWHAFREAGAGTSLEAIAAADSTRMAGPASFHITFGKNSAAISRTSAIELQAVAEQLRADRALGIRLISHPDTSSRKAANMKLADRRMTAIREFLVRQSGGGNREVAPLTAPQNASDTTKGLLALRVERNNAVDVTLLGRKPLVNEKVDSLLLARDADERAKQADSLAVGACAPPFLFNGRYTLIRLDERLPALGKTFDEARGEVTSAYQDFESKRLENEWVAALRKKFPVTEYKENLKEAVAPVSPTSSR